MPRAKKQERIYEQHKVLRIDFPELDAVYISMTVRKKPRIAGTMVRSRVLNDMKNPEWRPSTKIEKFILDNPTTPMIVEVVDDYQNYYDAKQFARDSFVYARDVENLNVLNIALDFDDEFA